VRPYLQIHGVHGHGRRAAAAAARRGFQVGGGAGIAEAARRDLDLRAAAPCEAASLELLDRQVYTVAEQCRERALHTVVTDESLEVAVLTAGEVQQRAIRTVGMAVDGLPDELEKRVGSTAKSAIQRGLGLATIDWCAKERQDRAEEASARYHVGARRPCRSRSHRAARRR